jgi:hypothetical protein
MLKSIVAVSAGFFLTGALAVGADLLLLRLSPGAFDAAGRVDSPLILTIMLAYVFAFATLGCYVCGRLAPRAPLQHAIVLGVLGLILNIVGTITKWALAPVWYHIVALLMVMPTAWIGGQIAVGARSSGGYPEPR